MTSCSERERLSRHKHIRTNVRIYADVDRALYDVLNEAPSRRRSSTLVKCAGLGLRAYLAAQAGDTPAHAHDEGACAPAKVSPLKRAEPDPIHPAKAEKPPSSKGVVPLPAAAMASFQ